MIGIGIKQIGDLAHQITSVALDPDKPGKEQPALFLYRPGRLGRSAIIPLECAWKYDEPESRAEQYDCLTACRNIALALDYPTDNATLAQIAMFIQDHLDALVDYRVPVREKTVVGRINGSLNGRKFEHELLD